jgi:hypothetical protein
MLEFLRPADRHHPGLARGGSPHQQRAHHLDLPHPPGELHDRDVVALGEPGHRLAETGADLLEHRRGGNRHAQVIVQEREDPAAGLQRRHIAIEVNPVQALDVQHGVTIQQLRDCDHMRHGDRLQHAPLRSQDQPARTSMQAEPSASAVRGGASLDE